jgi:hypothetical protein
MGSSGSQCWHGRLSTRRSPQSGHWMNLRGVVVTMASPAVFSPKLTSSSSVAAILLEDIGAALGVGDGGQVILR